MKLFIYNINMIINEINYNKYRRQKKNHIQINRVKEYLLMFCESLLITIAVKLLWLHCHHDYILEIENVFISKQIPIDPGLEWLNEQRRSN